ncbi:MAG: protein kinase, partial [Myxococcota bacterium]
MTQAGDTVAGYQLVRAVGEGPFGVVWHAVDANGATLAVKLLKSVFIQRPAGQAAFTRLLATLRLQELLKHDGLARVYGPVQDAAHSAYGMAVEYVEGRLVSEIRMPTTSDQEARSLSVVLAWFEEIGELLALLHSQGIVHGNLKPTNVKLVRETCSQSDARPRQVEQFDPVAVRLADELHIGGLQISVNDPLRMKQGQKLADFLKPSEDHRQRPRLLVAGRWHSD